MVTASTKIIAGLLLFQNLVVAQCLSGDCKNGFGKFDFGFAVYEGNFKNEKPNGKGIMDYGNGDKFEGNFTNGQEDGEGVLYKKNVPTKVIYKNGIASEKKEVTVIGGNAPIIDGCLQGDCYNGFGIIKFESGNRYEGNFENGIKSGDGSFYFAGGNVFKGTFKDNIYSKGIFSYTNEHVNFTGTFDKEGLPKSGDYYYKNNDATVTIVDGKITNIINPVAEKAKKLAEEQSKPHSCSACGGKGMVGGGSKFVTTQGYSSTNYVNSSGNVQYTSSGNTMNSSKWVAVMPTQCNACNGTGQGRPQGTIINSGRQ